MNLEIPEYDFDYHVNQEIKHIVIGIQDLHVRRNTEREYFSNKRSPQIDYLAHAKESAKHELLDHISDFILVKENEDRFYLEATLYLPYVRDSKVKELEKEIKHCLSDKSAVERNRNALLIKIKLLERPWYKKLWSKFSK